ncbi:hypothetical protein NG99_25780 [Erwinia typographi]|uniref:Bacterial CdiA-CT RNAse A domain-containing protein n=1 Tax=Erwinia typographi TaxID=371042 RepID=A0A0A3ZL73_9GAMM|nr:RNase A-like domain-containing protein [Erwinia typographi]KGT86468.1 hypothetical protein NG99_25780 [Erwinia typographi]
MTDDSGLSLAISPVQMAAILHKRTVSRGETMSNRLWGGLELIGGVVESFGAGALCIVPEPTMLSKAGCVVVGAHSLDTIKSSLNQVITGRESQTATAELAKLAAEQMGATTDTAYRVGVTVDLLVPFAFASAAGAARLSAVYSGRIRLAEHEGGALGHTIARHVNLTPEQMLARLTAPRAPTRASTFLSTQHAEMLVSDMFSVKRFQIENALKYMHSGSRLNLEHRFYFSTGKYIEKGTTEVKKAYGVRMIVEAKKYGDKTYYIVTAYPVP